MGYNTVAVLLNDNLDQGAKDSGIGQRILDASRSWSVRDYKAAGCLDIYARPDPDSGGCRAASYGSVISQDHADGYQVVVVHGNCGWRIDEVKYDQHLGWMAFEMMKECLERNGYRVTKKRKMKGDL